MNAFTRPWHETDEFWHLLEPVIFSESIRANAASEVEQIVKLLGLAAGAHLLDMPCGPGRHSLEFLKRGFRVTGVDRTVRYLDEACRSGEPFAPRAEWVRADMREFRRDGGFDAAINLFTSIGYFEDPFDDLRILRNFAASLKPGAPLVIDIMGREVLARIFREREWRELPDGSIFLEERRAVRNWTRIANRWLLVRPDGTRYESRHELRLFSGQELELLLRDAGFGSVRILGSYAGVPYDQNAPRLVAVATK